METLEENDQYRIKEIGRTYFFGSELITRNPSYSKALTKRHLEIYDIENIFAFDVLIRNVDRREQKPNILFQENLYYLIDHEQSLKINKDFLDYYNESNRWQFVYKDIKGTHLFYERLREIKRKVTFETFEFAINNFSLNNLDEIEDILKNKGFDTTDYANIRSYFESVRLNQSKFITLLHELIQ
jgi:hypothetical protein